MIETALVYIYSVSAAREFVGCGALVEGGYIATCRHVWRDAIVSESGETGEPPEVEIEFPFGKKETAGVAPARRAWLADACGEAEDSAPDLVLLGLIASHSIPGGVKMLNPATHDRFEVGLGRAHTYLASCQHYSTVDGSIDPEAGPDGLRQFRGAQLPNYWFEEGSSGSPVFLDKAEQLAGIISLSEIGGKQGVNRLREAFVVPATTIRKYLTARLAADAQAEKRGIDPAKLQPILAKLGVLDVPDDKIAERLDASVDDILAQAAKPVAVSNDGADIDAVIVASRAKLGALDTAGALDVLQAKLAGEEQERVRRRVPLLKERAAVERLAFDYDAAKKTLTEVTRLAPDDAWAFIELGDLYGITGPLDEAAKAFGNAEVTARLQGDERNLSVSFNRLGDVQVAQGDLAGALKSYQDSLAIAERLAKSDPDNAGWQRDLSVSFNKVGDVQTAQGDLAGALKSYHDHFTIMEQLAKSDPGNAGWQRDLSVSFERLGDVQVQQGDLAGALKSYNDRLAISDRLTKSDPDNAGGQHNLSVSYNKIGYVQQAQGDLAGALKSYSDSLAIFERLVKSDPGNAGWRRDLSVSYNRVGDVQKAQGDLAGALKSYQDDHAIMDRLAKSDPGNAGWQRDLSVSFERLGDVQKAQGDLAGALKSYNDRLAISDRLTKSDPGNAGWQRDLSVAFNKIGDVQKAQGDLAGALTSYRDDLAITDRLAKSDPGNAGWQRDLSVSYNKVGDVQKAQGDLAGALKSYNGGLATIERLATSNPANAGWQRDLSFSFGRLASAYRQSGDDAKALDALRQGQAIMARLTKLSPDNAIWKQDLARFNAQLAVLAER